MRQPPTLQPHRQPPRPVLVLLGPTAVGKTAVAVELCRRLGGEVIAADSRQIYRGLTIGSAAPTAAEIAEAPHHLVEFLAPDVVWSAAEFRDAAEAAIADVLARGRQPIVVAGTGFYVSTLVYGWTLTAQPADPALRARLEAEPADVLHARLAEVDPETAARLAPADRKRVVRALEVYELTGQPLSQHHRERGTQPVPYRYELHGLRRDRADLNARIDRRVEAMLAAGWLHEVDQLVADGLTGDEPAFEGLGYRRLLAHRRGELSLAEATELIQRDTRRFAKRQMTWFRGMAGVRWHDLPPEAEPAAVAAAICGQDAP